MRQTKFYWLSVTHAVAAVLFMMMVDYHFICGIMAIAGLVGAAHFADLHYDELKHIRSNADEDRPE